MRNALPLAAVATLAALAACASKPAVVTTPPTVTAPSQPTGPVPGSVQDFQVSVGDRVFFDYDQYSLRADARAALEKQAAWLAKYPAVRVLVAGSADERGTREYNLALGARRAASTKDYLVSLGVAASRVETVSYGKERPIDGRSNDAAWSLNRNAQTQITSGAVS
jgi:peptidoglycan-associated lipoprotein